MKLLLLLLEKAPWSLWLLLVFLCLQLAHRVYNYRVVFSCDNSKTHKPQSRMYSSVVGEPTVILCRTKKSRDKTFAHRRKFPSKHDHQCFLKSHPRPRKLKKRYLLLMNRTNNHHHQDKVRFCVSTTVAWHTSDCVKSICFAWGLLAVVDNGNL